jgi:pyrroline-5-carboxylate reductase
MGSALLQGAVASGFEYSSVTIVDPAPLPPHLRTLPRVAAVASADTLLPDIHPDLIVIAVKPQQLAATLPAYAKFHDAVFLSIAAGVTIARLEILLGGNPAVTRAMPNLPASIGQGISALVANTHTKPHQRMMCANFMAGTGDIVWLDDETAMDAVTAVSGSGPAYIFALCEAMAKAAESLGLSRELAMRLARKTVIGSSALLAQSPDSAEALRHAVTSPGGTTEAALKILLSEIGLPDLMTRSLAAAAMRAKELSQ